MQPDEPGNEETGRFGALFVLLVTGNESGQPFDRAASMERHFALRSGGVTIGGKKVSLGEANRAALVNSL
jgi:hypothetical protein